MSFNIVKSGEATIYKTLELVCESIADLENLPVEAGAGSICYCFEDKKFYMLDFAGTWQPIA